MTKRILLGPQRPITNLGTAVAEAGLPDGPLAVISAGWQEAEADIDDVRAVIGRQLVDLRLYERAEQTFAAAPDLLAAYRERQDRLQALQRLYRSRLRRLLAAARRMLSADAEPSLIDPEQRHAIAQLRALDRHHMRRVNGIYKEFDATFATDRHELLARHVAEISEVLNGIETVVITGGNVAVLVNRLRLFGVGALLSARNIVAWSAGVMALSDCVVLFHDNPPQGRRNPEVFGPGLGLLKRQVFFPNANARLRTSNRVHMQLLCRRFAPSACITLDSGAVVRVEDGNLVTADKARQVVDSGRLQKVKPR